MRIIKKIFLYGFLSFVGLLLLLAGYLVFFVKINPPEVADKSALQLQKTVLDSNTAVLGNNWITKDKEGLYEMYIEGKPFERGVIYGKLAQKLVKKQEDNFVHQLQIIIPSKRYLGFLKYFVAWFNRNIDKYVQEEYKEEIYGVSFSAPDEYDFIGSKYQRMLNYHAAHDIGHALQDKNMVVGCTSFGVWNTKSADTTLVLGRNFDFFVGEGFAEDKLICFYKPASGYKFMFITWGGMIGAVSGMNEKGISVTINAAKSAVPSGSATPISILAREILQYAKNIDDAYAIAKKRTTFVSESILIGSKADNKAVIIEKSPLKIGIVESKEDEILCTNHYQSDVFKDDEKNIKNIAESASDYRYKRLKQLLNRYPKLDTKEAALVLRDRGGMDDKNIGMGNEKAVNQLIAHHSVIFKPQQLKVWVSTNPYQLGKYVCYDLNTVFANAKNFTTKTIIETDSLAIPADNFLQSEDYKHFVEFKSMKAKINIAKKDKNINLGTVYINSFLKTNPEYYDTYRIAADYYKAKNNNTEAIKLYKMALTKEIATLTEKRQIATSLNKLTAQ
jgi:isopenicillin-N N-acyltransferase-like protein